MRYSEPVAVDLEICAVISRDQEELEAGGEEREPEELVVMVDGGRGIRVVAFFGRILGRGDLLILVGGAAVVILSVVHGCSRPGRGDAAVEMGWRILVVVFCEL